MGCVGEGMTVPFEPARAKEEPAPTQVLVYQMQVFAATFLLSLAVSNPTRQATDGHAFGQSPTV